MSRRKTVKLNLDFVKPRIKEVCRSNVVFSEKMGRPNQKTWVTGWGINKNLPSPEEAAQMCAILQVTPEEMLTDPEDIELVRDLIESQRGTGERPEKKPADAGEPQITKEEVMSYLLGLSFEDLSAFFAELMSGQQNRESGKESKK